MCTNVTPEPQDGMLAAHPKHKKGVDSQTKQVYFQRNSCSSVVRALKPRATRSRNHGNKQNGTLNALTALSTASIKSSAVAIPFSFGLISLEIKSAISGVHFPNILKTSLIN